MEIEQIEALLPDFSFEVLRDFETDQKEFKSITVQKIFGIVERRKNVNSIIPLMKKPPFWEGVHSNIHLFRQRVMDELMQFEHHFNKESKIDYFFEYLDQKIE